MNKTDLLNELRAIDNGRLIKYFNEYVEENVIRWNSFGEIFIYVEENCHYFISKFINHFPS